MKILHTYIPAGGSALNNHLIHYITLSVLLAKRHYHNVTLYTNREIGAIIKKMGIPYTEINTSLLSDIGIKLYTVPKMVVYSVQDEPFIHIDMDTLLYKKINFEYVNDIYGTYNEGYEKMITYNSSDHFFYETYIKNAFILQKRLPSEFTKHVNFSEIVNMSVFGGHNFSLISEASKYCVNIYNKEQSFLDSAYSNGCIIEQLFVPAAIRMLIGESLDTKFNFLFKRNPTIIVPENLEYPFEINSNGERLLIKDDADLFRNATYEFNGFLHLAGYKNFDRITFLIRQKILFDFEDGPKYIRKIDEYFNNETTLYKLHKKYLSYLADKINPAKKIL